MRELVVTDGAEDGKLHQDGHKLIFASPYLIYWLYWNLTARYLCVMSVVALITEKLQKQSLDECSPTTSTSTTSTVNIPICCESTVSLPQTILNTSNNLSIKGKNVWTFDTSSFGNIKQDGNRRGGRGNKGNKTTNLNTVCDTSPTTPNAPPPKKHCRSLSVPPDQSMSPWQPILYKPIPVMYNKDFNLHSTKFSAQGPVKDVSASSRSNFTKSFFHSASPVSVDSGHVTSSDFQTPPGSPIPRPASAMSEISHSSWFEHSPVKFEINRFEILQNRSLSCEDRISSGPIGRSGSQGLDSIRHTSPPRIHRIPRCKSQPCVLHDRKIGKKRRHDYDRPTLDFTKMTQTAYSSESIPRSKPLSFSPLIQRSHGGLVPIASSPLDTDIPFQGLENFPTSPIDDVSATEDTSRARARDHSSSTFQQNNDYLLDSGLDEECNCHIDEREQDLFPLKDLDMDEIEKH